MAADPAAVVADPVAGKVAGKVLIGQQGATNVKPRIEGEGTVNPTTAARLDVLVSGLLNRRRLMVSFPPTGTEVLSLTKDLPHAES